MPNSIDFYKGIFLHFILVRVIVPCMDSFTFPATVPSSCYHVYKTTSWINPKVGDKVTVELETTTSSLETNPYACAIRMKNKYFSNLFSWTHST